MTDCKHDADLHYLQAIEALTRVHPRNAFTSESEATHRLMLAHVAAVMAQTVVLERIAAALEQRAIPVTVALRGTGLSQTERIALERAAADAIRRESGRALPAEVLDSRD